MRQYLTVCQQGSLPSCWHENVWERGMLRVGEWEAERERESQGSGVSICWRSERRKSKKIQYFSTSFQLQWCLYQMVISLSSGIMSLSNIKENKNHLEGDVGRQTKECLGIFQARLVWLILFFSWKRFLSFVNAGCGCMLRASVNQRKEENVGTSVCASVSTRGHVCTCAQQRFHMRLSWHHRKPLPLPRGEQGYISSLFRWCHIQTSMVTLPVLHRQSLPLFSLETIALPLPPAGPWPTAHSQP